MNPTMTISRQQDTGGFVHNASALHTTPAAQPKSRKWTFRWFRKADILTRQRQCTWQPYRVDRGDGPVSRTEVATMPSTAFPGSAVT